MLSNFGNWLLRGKSDGSLKEDNEATSEGGAAARISVDARQLPTSPDAYANYWSNLIAPSGVANGDAQNYSPTAESAQLSNGSAFLLEPAEAQGAAGASQPLSGVFGMPDGAKAPPAPSGPAFDGLIVQFNAGVTASQRAAAIASINGRVKDLVRAGDSKAGDLVVIEIGGQLPEKAIQALSNSPAIKFAEPNWLLGVQATPAISNDTYYTNGAMWGMYGDATTTANIYGSQAGEAWAAGYTGNTKTVVGDIDTGLDYTHSDLYLNVWLNQGELRAGVVDTDGDNLITFRDLNDAQNASLVSDLNGNKYIDAGDLLADSNWANRFDNDGNGYVDDLIGWDFVNNDNNPYDDNNHGTHTAGTIGAMGGNGLGVVGVNWNVEIMPLKFLSATGSGAIANAIKALDYYTAAAATDVKWSWASEFLGTNNSWGGGGFSQAMQDAITRSAKQDLLFIAAAGNASSNNDKTANYPSNYSTLATAGFESVIAVAALTSAGALASFSNYGAKTVDLAAPGDGIMSTIPGGGYASYSGTSMATPGVTGALALEAALHPEYSASQLRDLLLSSTSYTSSLVGKTYTWGRLDIGAMTSGASPTNIVGSTIYGTTSNNTITGTANNDTLSGVPSSGTNLGKGTIDTLIGNGGYDLFLLGDSRGIFYNDGSNTSPGTGDYGLIKDFTSQDMIQLKSGSYWMSSVTVGANSGMGIYADTNNNRRFDTSDELIGLVQGAAPSTSNIVWA